MKPGLVADSEDDILDEAVRLTKSFNETVKARADRDPAFRCALVAEAVNCLVEGDVATMKTILRDSLASCPWNAKSDAEVLTALMERATNAAWPPCDVFLAVAIGFAARRSGLLAGTGAGAGKAEDNPAWSFQDIEEGRLAAAKPLVDRLSDAALVAYCLRQAELFNAGAGNGVSAEAWLLESVAWRVNGA